MILARRKAALMLKMKFSHMTASKYREAPVAVKQRIEDRVKSKQSLINRLAKKILPKLRIADKERLARRAEKK
jgi:ppGpp synthetase/RelA/SpoT-type nucleotidyltranferase